jgi:hypothetical protein
MRKLAFTCIPLLLLVGQPVFAHGWQAAAMWDWALNTANPRFDAQQAQIDTLLSDNLALQAQLDALSTQVANIESNTVLDLDGVLVATSLHGNPVARFQGVNVQVVNGGTVTQSINGLGNLIVGYDEAAAGGPLCSDGSYADEPACTGGGASWAASHKSGSHYLIVGNQNNYSQYGGVVIGQSNSSNSPYGSVSGGSQNKASGIYANVSGGLQNSASGSYSSVGGGLGNSASGFYSSASGGDYNTASGSYSSVSGGASNTASSSSSSVSGGFSNEADGSWSSVSGGFDHDAPGIDDWAAGSLFEDN